MNFSKRLDRLEQAGGATLGFAYLIDKPDDWTADAALDHLGVKATEHGKVVCFVDDPTAARSQGPFLG